MSKRLREGCCDEGRKFDAAHVRMLNGFKCIVNILNEFSGGPFRLWHKGCKYLEQNASHRKRSVRHSLLHCSNAGWLRFVSAIVQGFSEHSIPVSIVCRSDFSAGFPARRALRLRRARDPARHRPGACIAARSSPSWAAAAAARPRCCA